MSRRQDEDFVATLQWQLGAARLDQGEREYRFHPERKWRFDLAWPAKRVALEVDGGVWVQGRHTTGAGFEADSRKLSSAAVLGWRVLRVTPNMVRTGEALTLVEQAFATDQRELP